MFDYADGGVTNAIEESGFYHGIMNHIVKDNAVADFQGLRKGEVTHTDIVAG